MDDKFIAQAFNLLLDLLQTTNPNSCKTEIEHFRVSVSFFSIEDQCHFVHQKLLFWYQYIYAYDMTKWIFNLLAPKSDQHLISPYNITPESHIKVMRMKEMITNLRSSQKLKKFLLLAPWEQYEEYTYWFKGVNGWYVFLEFLTTGDTWSDTESYWTHSHFQTINSSGYLTFRSSMQFCVLC